LAAVSLGATKEEGKTRTAQSTHLRLVGPEHVLQAESQGTNYLGVAAVSYQKPSGPVVTPAAGAATQFYPAIK
jgi:hypothetical protein